MLQELEPTNRKVSGLVPWLHTEVPLGKIRKMLLVALFHQRVCERLGIEILLDAFVRKCFNAPDEEAPCMAASDISVFMWQVLLSVMRSGNTRNMLYKCHLPFIMVSLSQSKDIKNM